MDLPQVRARDVDRGPGQLRAQHAGRQGRDLRHGQAGDAGRITLEDLKRCGCAHTVIEILCDHTGFWKYDNRESLPHDDEEDDEIEEEEGVDMAAEDDEDFRRRD